MKNARIELRLPAATKERWLAYCEAHRLSFTDLIAQSVEQHLREQQQQAKQPAKR